LASPSNPRNLVNLSGNTYLMRGSPVTIVYSDRETVYVIDPGHGSKRSKQLRQALSDLGAGSVTAVITHYHSDHLSITGKMNPTRTISSRQDRLCIEDPRLRILVTFGYPIPPGHPSLPFDAPGVKVTETVEPGESIDGVLETIPLPGHTPGQIGVATPDGVLYLADSAFGLRVLENYYIPYHLDYDTALKTLYKIRDEYASEYKTIVFGHGPLVSKQEALRIIEENISHHEKIRNEILETAPGHSIEETVIEVLRKAGKKPTLQLVLLASGSARSVIASEYNLELGEDKVVAKWA
jgi:glyoxylase-like metal-dependent hydrolase (beta-lactamase superfamily II)